jgi:hypothetical protein
MLIKSAGRLLLILCLLGPLSGCFVSEYLGSEKLTDKKIEQYVKAYAAIERIAPDLVVGSGDDNVPKGGHDKLAAIEAAVQSAGFKDYKQFSRTNAAVAWAVGQAQAAKFKGGLASEQTAALKELDAQLNDPNVSASTKARLEAERKRIEEDFTKKKRVAELATGVTGWFTDQESVAVVARHGKELQGIFMKGDK